MKAILIAVIAFGTLGLTQISKSPSPASQQRQRHFYTSGSFVVPIEHTRRDEVFQLVEAIAKTEGPDLFEPTFAFINASDSDVTAGAFLLRLYDGDRVVYEVQQSFDSKLIPESSPVKPSGTMTADFTSILGKFGGNITRVEIITDYIELADGRTLGPNSKRIDRQIAATRQGAKAMLDYLRRKYATGGTRALEHVLNLN
jgi:hypothetical protein